MKRTIGAAIAAMTLFAAGGANAAHVLTTFQTASGSPQLVTDNCAYFGGGSTPACKNIAGSHLISEQSWTLEARDAYAARYGSPGLSYIGADWADILIYARNSGSGADETFYLGFVRDGLVHKTYFTIPAAQKRSFDVYRTSISADVSQGVGSSIVRFIIGSDDPHGPVIGHVQTYIQAVPEPSTWAMMIVGFAGVGAAVRRSRRTTSRPNLEASAGTGTR